MDQTQNVGGAEANTLTNPKITLAVIPSIPDVPAFVDNSRSNQQSIAPGAVQSRLLGNLFSTNPSDPSQVLTGTFRNLANASSISFIFTVSDPAGRQIIAIPEIAFVVNGENFPGADFGFGATPIYIYNDLNLSNGNNLVVRAAMRNNSGGSIDRIDCNARFRIIANPTPANVTT